MKTYIYLLFLGLSLVAFIMPCSMQNKNLVSPQIDEFSLNVSNHVYGQLVVYCDDSLIYKGNVVKDHEGMHVFISNINKESMTKFKFIAMGRDTTFSIPTNHIDSLVIGFTNKGVFSMFGNHTRAAWLID